ncbi:hypothetical protein AB0L05_27940 [Nonomuraea pusilla]|uniref:hypothetical protein n=1 Tax=Nonomuraea pusilla TaxID=46177 RepID=UPI003331C4BC
MSNSTPGQFTSEAQAAWYGGLFRYEEEPKPRPRRPRKQAVAAELPPLPEIGRPEWGVPIYGKDLQIGDVVVHLHRDFQTHKIDRFEPYKGGLALPSDARTAYADTWGISVGPFQVVRILPRDGAR